MNKEDMPVNLLRVCVDYRTEDEIRGTIWAAALEQPLHFNSRLEFAVKVEEAYNRIGKPQSSQVLRSLKKDEKPVFHSYVGDPVRYHTVDEIRGKSGTVRTLDLLVITRQYAEWQGILKDADGTVIGKFESALQCVKLL